MMAELLVRLDHWLASNRPDYYALLQPGATDAELDGFESRLNIQLPQTFRQLYRWRNGQAASSFEALVLNRSFCSLEEIASSKEELDNLIGSDFEDPKYWRRGWVPFLHNGGGSYLCLDTEALDGGEAGQLIGFWKADHDRPIEASSLEVWMADLVQAMESGTLELAE